MATTVRVDESLAERLREIATAEHRSIGQVIADAVEHYQTEKFWTGVHASYTRLRSDAGTWSDYQREVAQLEGTSMDGLADESPYYTPE
jgi:hypothetical protein